MTTIICDLSVDWMECPYCSMLKGCVESAESTCRAASERLDQAYADYRSEREAGRAEIGTGQWSVWQDRLRYLEHQLTAAHDTWGNAIDEWADCIHTHRRLYEDQQREADAETDRTDVLPETEEMSTVPAIKIAHSHDLTASTAECPLCGMLDRDRIDARAALAARAQNLHMLTDKYIHQLETGGLGYDGLGEWTDRLLEAGDDWSSHQSAVTNAEWRYRNAITVHGDLSAARRCETEDSDAENEECTDDTGREESRRTAREIIADYMGVPADDVHIICSGIFGAADEPNQPHEQEQSTLAAIPLAEVKSILAKRKTEYEKFRDSCARRGAPSYGAGWAIGAIQEVRDDIDKLTTTEEATNA